MNGHTTSPAQSSAFPASRKQFMDFAPRKKYPSASSPSASAATVSTTRTTTVSATHTTTVSHHGQQLTTQRKQTLSTDISYRPTQSPAAPVRSVRPMPQPLRSTPKKHPIAVHATSPQPYTPVRQSTAPASSAASRPTPAHPATILYPTHTQQHGTTQTSYNTSRLKKRDDFLDLDDTFGLLDDEDFTTEETVITTTQSEVSRSAQPEKSSPFKLKSPFVNTKVDKRPLSGDRPDAEHVAALKNAYPTRAMRKKPQVDDNVPTMVKTGASAKSNIGLAIAILLTVIVGAAVGTVAYLAFFQ